MVSNTRKKDDGMVFDVALSSGVSLKCSNFFEVQQFPWRWRKTTKPKKHPKKVGKLHDWINGDALYARNSSLLRTGGICEKESMFVGFLLFSTKGTLTRGNYTARATFWRLKEVFGGRCHHAKSFRLKSCTSNTPKLESISISLSTAK